MIYNVFIIIFRYFINFLLDSTLGLLIIFVGIRTAQILSKRKGWECINFGEYGKICFLLLLLYAVLKWNIFRYASIHSVLDYTVLFVCWTDDAGKSIDNTFYADGFLGKHQGFYVISHKQSEFRSDFSYACHSFFCKCKDTFLLFIFILVYSKKWKTLKAKLFFRF